MTPKTIIFIIAVLIILLVTFAAGIHTGKRYARQVCLDTVAENCEYICGVGADFTFPDQEQETSQDPDEYIEESLVAFQNDSR